MNINHRITSEVMTTSNKAAASKGYIISHQMNLWFDIDVDDRQLAEKIRTIVEAQLSNMIPTIKENNYAV